MNKNYEMLIKSNKPILAFNFDNLEIFKSLILASEELNHPIIIMITESSIKNLGLEYAVGFIESYKKLNKKRNIFFHLDHAFDLDLIKKCIDLGFDSVMFDGSRLKDEENIEKTILIKKYAQRKNVFLEAEIGHIGGKEDDLKTNNKFTTVEQAINFYKKTKVDFLAIAVGTQHGEYKTKPNLQYQLIKEIQDKIEAPLVLHGCSGLSVLDIKNSIKVGIRKINIGTDLKRAYFLALQSIVKTQEKDLRKISKYIIEYVKQEIINKIKTICY